ncbi:phosphoribosyl-ATP diphosphatase [Candidatus Vallotia lariciata]|uniref:phosphoribosyl-ATP diphosphatase n=1 Tax=Candidatus Vallotia laricis TaxID=2018052 RepID=UPI001D034120|nr:phosphoribosyl-ATP diphosphatase [Candidatus Vallotia lariciata]
MINEAVDAHSLWDENYARHDILVYLAAIIDSRKAGDPKDSYVAQLCNKGADAILKKVGEEAIEVVMAAKDASHNSSSTALVKEMADLWFHSLIMLSYYGVGPNNVLAELKRRAGLSGIEEKALRK